MDNRGAPAPDTDPEKEAVLADMEREIDEVMDRAFRRLADLDRARLAEQPGG